MIWTTEFSGKFPAKATFGDCFSSYTATDLGYLKEKKQPTNQPKPKEPIATWLGSCSTSPPCGSSKNPARDPCGGQETSWPQFGFAKAESWKRWGRGILERANSAPPELEQPGDGQRQPFCWWWIPPASISITSGGVSTLQWASSSGYQPLQTAALKNSSSVITHVGGGGSYQDYSYLPPVPPPPRF